MAEKIKNIPSPDILMNSLRSIGYSFKTAVADIIDNSISADAKNIWIDFPSYSSDNLYITILDDAIGMDDAALFNAMKYGSERDEYGEKDLGRFGVGLKSASLSQCRTLTVMSKFNGDIHAYRWDLDEVLRSKEWECLRLDFDEIQACPNYEKLNSLVQGTMVVWQNFDIADQKSNKLYGQFIVDVLETYGVDVVSTIIFTGDRRLGVPQGKDIYDYLKDCFREDLMVIFLFSKAFYDSNICISEAGAAWATNQNCMNVVIDISFSDIEKPSNNALSSIKFQQIRTPDQTITVTEFFKTIIEEGLHFEYDESKLQKALNYVLKTDKYSDQKIDFPATFLPKRKFLPVPRCPKCHNIMLLTEENGRLKYVCSNVSCDECYEAVIN